MTYKINFLFNSQLVLENSFSTKKGLTNSIIINVFRGICSRWFQRKTFILNPECISKFLITLWGRLACIKLMFPNVQLSCKTAFNFVNFSFVLVPIGKTFAHDSSKENNIDEKLIFFVWSWNLLSESYN